MARTRRGRGEGGVSFREDKKLWVGTLSLGYGKNGRRRRKKVYGKTKKEALSKLDALRAQAGAGQLPDAGGLTVGQLLTRWLDASRGHTADRTWEERTRVVDGHLAPRIGSVRLSRLTALHVEALYTELRAVGGWAPRQAADALTAALNHGVRLRLIPANPADAVKKPRPPKADMVVLDPGRANALLEAARKHPLGKLVAVALGTGCRQGELLGLAWDRVDLAGGVLHVHKCLSKTKAGYVLKDPKTAAGRRAVTLPWFAADALAERRAEAEAAGLLAAPVFCTRTGNYLDRKNVRRGLHAIAARANKAAAAAKNEAAIPAGLRFHGLRHTHASLLLSAGHSLRAVSQRLGHANPALTLRIYGHVMPTDDGRLADGMGAIVRRPGNGPT